MHLEASDGSTEADKGEKRAYLREVEGQVKSERGMMDIDEIDEIMVKRAMELEDDAETLRGAVKILRKEIKL